MSDRVIAVVKEMERINLHPSLLFASKDELLIHYPELVFKPHTKDKDYIWHDKEKQATPEGIKNSLRYELKVVLPLIEEELEFLVKIRNSIVLILQVVKAARNKKFVLSVLEYLYDMVFSTGGGTSCMVRRIILIYLREGKLNTDAKKRKIDTEIDELSFPVHSGHVYDDIDDLTESDIDEAATEFLIIPAETSQPVKKVKTLDCPIIVAAAQLAVDDVEPLTDWLERVNMTTEHQPHQEVLDNLELELLEEYSIKVYHHERTV